MEKDAKMAEICGAHLGDGYARRDDSNRTEIDISGSIEEKEYYKDHLAPLFSEKLNIKIETKKFESRGTYGFKIYDREIVEYFLDSLNMPNGKKKNPEIPEFIIQGSKKIKCRFLRGLYDTDGHIGFYKRYGNYSDWKKNHHHYPRVSVVNTGQKLMEQSSKILDELEIGYFTREIDSKDKNWRRKYKINSVGEARLKAFISNIGFKNPVKVTRYKIWNKYGFCPSGTSLEERYKILEGELNPESFY